jgi:hypothetical protein
MEHTPFLVVEADNINMAAFDIKPIEGYETPENFPDCCEGHKFVVADTEKYLAKFPDCCDKHRAFAEKFEVNSSDFSYLKQKVVKQLSYTEYHIEKKINQPNWYKDITDYVHLNALSFGIPGIGLHLYEHFLLQHIEASGKISENKRKKLLDSFYNKEESKTNSNTDMKRDINVLYATYQKWLKYFPFELTYFKILKKQFSKTFPFISKTGDYNPYTGFTVSSLQSQAGLVEQLINVTKKLLALIRSDDWLQGNSIDAAQSLKLELKNETHRVKQLKLVDEISKSEARYIKIINKWLQNEKEFFKDIEAELNQKQLPAPKEVKQQAFHYKGDPENLSNTLNALHKLNAISKEIKLPQFKKMFNGERIDKPISWEADQGDLMIFIKYITKSPNLKFPYQQQWNIAVQCFRINNIKLSSVNLKTCKSTTSEHKFRQAAKNLL